MMKLCVTYQGLCQGQTVHTYTKNSKYTAKKNPVSLQHANLETLKSFMFFTCLWYYWHWLDRSDDFFVACSSKTVISRRQYCCHPEDNLNLMVTTSLDGSEQFYFSVNPLYGGGILMKLSKDA